MQTRLSGPFLRGVPPSLQNRDALDSLGAREQQGNDSISCPHSLVMTLPRAQLLQPLLPPTSLGFKGWTSFWDFA